MSSLIVLSNYFRRQKADPIYVLMLCLYALSYYSASQQAKLVDVTPEHLYIIDNIIWTIEQ